MPDFYFKKPQSLSSTWVRVCWEPFNKTERVPFGKILLSWTPVLSSLCTEKITLRNSDSVWAPEQHIWSHCPAACDGSWCQKLSPLSLLAELLVGLLQMSDVAWAASVMTGTMGSSRDCVSTAQRNVASQAAKHSGAAKLLKRFFQLTWKPGVKPDALKHNNILIRKHLDG